MRGYYDYLERQIKLREEEIKLYKDFVERELGCRIRVTLETIPHHDGIHERPVQYKVIEIPQSRFYIQVE